MSRQFAFQLSGEHDVLYNPGTAGDRRHSLRNSSSKAEPSGSPGVLPEGDGTLSTAGGSIPVGEDGYGEGRRFPDHDHGSPRQSVRLSHAEASSRDWLLRFGEHDAGARRGSGKGISLLPRTPSLLRSRHSGDRRKEFGGDLGTRVVPAWGTGHARSSWREAAQS